MKWYTGCLLISAGYCLGDAAGYFISGSTKETAGVLFVFVVIAAICVVKITMAINQGLKEIDKTLEEMQNEKYL